MLWAEVKMTNLPTVNSFLPFSPDQFLHHWLGHRRLTRRVIEAFPADQLFSFTPAPPVRSFGQLAWEVHGQSEEIVLGLIDGTWGSPTHEALPSTDKTDLLRAWDELSARIETGVPHVALSRYSELIAYHRQNEPVLEAALGEIDNEVHHRGQGMVYLRLLGIQPPEFWDSGEQP